MTTMHLNPELVLSPDGKIRSAVELVKQLETMFPERTGTPNASDAELRYQQGARTVVRKARELVYGNQQ